MLSLKKSPDLSAYLFTVLTLTSACATDIGDDGMVDAEELEVGVSEQAMVCNTCVEDNEGSGSSGGPPASPSNPDSNGWTGMNPKFECTVELILHPAGYVGNRVLLPLLRDADILNSLDDCYGMATGKVGIAEAVVGFLSSGASLVTPIAQAAMFNIGMVNRCVCQEFKW